MAADEIHVGDTKTRITLTFTDAGAAVDVSWATTKQLIFMPPDGTAFAVDATFTVAGVDGKIYYDTLATTFDEDGEWRLQGYVADATRSWKSDVHTFTVYPNLI